MFGDRYSHITQRGGRISCRHAPGIANPADRSGTPCHTREYGSIESSASFTQHTIAFARGRICHLPDTAVATIHATAKADSARPLLVYFHGGGWTFGSINSCSRFCGELVAQADIAVLAVDYALAPKAPFPHGLNDCIDAVRFAKQHAKEWDSASHLVSAGGDSAGGNLAVATTLSLLASDSIPLHSLVLFYPITLTYTDHSESWQHFGSGFALDSELMEAFNQAYAPQNAHHHLISVAHAPDELLSQLPPILLIAAERDILCSQGRDFSHRLTQLGVNISRYELPATVHLFITVPGQPLAFNHALSLTASFLRLSSTDMK